MWNESNWLKTGFSDYLNLRRKPRWLNIAANCSLVSSIPLLGFIKIGATFSNKLLNYPHHSQLGIAGLQTFDLACLQDSKAITYIHTLHTFLLLDVYFEILEDVFKYFYLLKFITFDIIRKFSEKLAEEKRQSRLFTINN